MILYFRALTSIFLSLLAISIGCAFIGGIYSLSSDSDSIGFSGTLGMALVFAMFGMILFGFTGALFWSILFKISNRFFKTAFKAHVFAVMLSIPLVIVLFFCTQSRTDYDTTLDITRMFIFLIVPVALVSLYIYKKSYLESAAVDI